MGRYRWFDKSVLQVTQEAQEPAPGGGGGAVPPVARIEVSGDPYMWYFADVPLLDSAVLAGQGHAGAPFGNPNDDNAVTLAGPLVMPPYSGPYSLNFIVHPPVFSAGTLEVSYAQLAVVKGDGTEYADWLISVGSQTIPTGPAATQLQFAGQGGNNGDSFGTGKLTFAHNAADTQDWLAIDDAPHALYHFSLTLRLRATGLR